MKHKKRIKMKTKQTIGMSLALATLISLGVTGCGGSSDNATATAVDVTVERGKVFDANVIDSSKPAQVATQKVGKNVYTFANAPVYPVVVSGGWIDVNDNGKMDENDIKLDIEMKSYGTTVTPLTTLMATKTKKEDRDAMYKALADRLNATGIGEDTKVTVEDLYKVPSEAPRDVMIVANAIFKDMKEKNTYTLDLNDVMTQFATIDSTLIEGATAKDAEALVIESLMSQNIVTKISAQDISEPIHQQPDAVVGGDTTLNLDAYSSIIIFKNTTDEEVVGLKSELEDKRDFTFAIATPTTSCADYGFTNLLRSAEEGISTKLYMNSLRTCMEVDYKNAVYASGSKNVIIYYNY
jgi:hypothetical protein